jgi:hypothetical protein
MAKNPNDKLKTVLQNAPTRTLLATIKQDIRKQLKAAKSADNVQKRK